MSLKVAIEHALDAVQKGEIDRSEANVFVVQLMGVRIVNGPMPRQVRSELMSGVKAGKIGRLPKDGLKPEAFFHKNAKADALEARAKIAGESIEAIRKVFA